MQISGLGLDCSQPSIFSCFYSIIEHVDDDDDDDDDTLFMCQLKI